MSAKPLKGLGSRVLEVVSDHRGDTFRSVYTVRFAARVFVLHAFQKKSKSGDKLAGFSLDRLVRFLVQIGSDVEIVLKPRSRATKRARVMVA